MIVRRSDVLVKSSCIGLRPVSGGKDQGLSLSEGERESSSKALAVKVRRRLRRCASLDNQNPWYEGLLEERRGRATKNFIQANKVCGDRANDTLSVHVVNTPYLHPHPL